MDKHRPHHLPPTLKSARIALVYKAAEQMHYSPTGLGIVAAQTAKALRAHGVWADAWACASGEQLLERLHHTDEDASHRSDVAPTHVVVFAPWIATELLARIAEEFPNIVIVVTSHSNFGFLAADPNAVKLMREAAERQTTTHNVCWRQLPTIHGFGERGPRRRGGVPAESDASWRAMAAPTFDVGRRFSAARPVRSGPHPQERAHRGRGRLRAPAAPSWHRPPHGRAP